MQNRPQIGGVVNVGAAFNHQVMSMGLTQGETIVTAGAPMPPQIVGYNQGVATGVGISTVGVGAIAPPLIGASTVVGTGYGVGGYGVGVGGYGVGVGGYNTGYSVGGAGYSGVGVSGYGAGYGGVGYSQYGGGVTQTPGVVTNVDLAGNVTQTPVMVTNTA